MIKNFKDYYGDKLAASVGDIGHLNEFDYKCMAIGEPFVKALQGNAARQNLICPPSLVKLCLEEITVTKIVTCTDI